MILAWETSLIGLDSTESDSKLAVRIVILSDKNIYISEFPLSALIISRIFNVPVGDEAF